MLLGHLHNQDAVLRRQTNQRHQTHLGIDVEVDRANRQKHQRTEHGQGHGHQDDHRRHIALVLGRKHQIHDENAQGEHQNTGASGGELKRGDTCEGIADVIEIEAVEDVLNGCERLTGTLADRLSPLHQHGAIEVVVADHRWCTGEIRLSKLRHLHHLAVSVADVIAEDVVEIAALIRLRLHIDVAHLTALVGEAGVVATREHSDGLHRLLEINVQSAQDRAIDLQAESRCAGHKLGVEGGELTTGLAGAHQLLSQIIELSEGVSTVAEIVELEIEATLC